MRSNLYKFILFIIFPLFLCNLSYSLEKVSIALMDFKGNDVSESTCQAMTDAASTMLVNCGRFTVAERERIRTILEQLAFEQSGMTEEAVKIGKMLNVQKLIFGNISLTGKTYQINISLVDVEKAEREIQENHRFAGREDYLIDEVEKVMEIIIDNIPLVGNIIDDTVNGFIVDFGKRQGINTGDKLVISREAGKVVGLNGEIIGMREEKIAEACVKSVEDTWCEIILTLNTSAIIDKGYFVKLKTTPDKDMPKEDKKVEPKLEKTETDTSQKKQEPIIPVGF